MKKLLVVLLSAAMVLSLAAVSMAAGTVKGDFRYDMYQDESNSADESYAISDMRLIFEGNISDSVSALFNYQIQHTNKKGDGNSETSADWNEYYITYKESWGSVKAGYYEYKFTPDRAILKSGQYHVWQKSDVMAAFTFNTPIEGLTADVLFQPYAQYKQYYDRDDGSYGVSVAYDAEKWGVKATYADFGHSRDNNDDNDLYAIDIHYNINDTMKVFALGVDYSENDKDKATSRYNKWGIDGFDPVLGFSWDKIAGTTLFAAIEYAINPRFEDNDAQEFDEYTINLKYKFTDKTAFELEHYQVAKDQTKDIFRLRYQF